ncbi:DUF4261 domain-containing protein [Paenibacillus sp. GCM10027626]|uniref:DUF4261 domain-containing protein n=1 Tax=Paenibacillus sp. GCM10027626 TaxID=3273411 RepID=UPI003630D7C9
MTVPFQQNLDEQSDFQRIFQMYLLFKEEPERPAIAAIHEALMQKCGKVDIVSADEMLSSFAIEAYNVEYSNGTMPAQTMIADVTPFEQQTISEMERSQFWNLPDGAALLEQCRYKILMSDFMSAGLPIKDRCSLLADWIEVAVKLFPTCAAVWIPASGKLLLPEEIKENPYEGPSRFLQFGINIRYFNVHGTEDSLMDSLGLYAIGLTDIQYHFHTLDPNDVSRHAFNVAAYLFESEAELKDGDTMAGMRDGEMVPDIFWKCHYEHALVQPAREVIDICPNEFAAGNRELEEEHS